MRPSIILRGNCSPSHCVCGWSGTRAASRSKDGWSREATKIELRKGKYRSLCPNDENDWMSGSRGVLILNTTTLRVQLYQ
jgi:hypothetical protein